MNDGLCTSFGLAVRQLRERKKWSQEQLAAQSNLNRSYVGEIERGCVIASIVTAQKLARALDIGLAGLIAECEQFDQVRPPQNTAITERTGPIP